MFWKRTRKFLIVSLSVGAIFFGLIMIDLKLSRGAILASIFNVESEKFITVPEADPNTKYEITKLANGNYNFRFENNAITPKYYTGYRDEKYQVEMEPAIFFMHALWTQLVLPDTIIGFGENWGCGTGLGILSVNPFEVFEEEFTYDFLLQQSCWELPFNSYKDTLFDPIYNEPILKDSNGYWTQINSDNSIIPKTDSIQAHYYLYLKLIINHERYMVKSNGIKLNYMDLLNKWLELERGYQIEFAE